KTFKVVALSCTVLFTWTASIQAQEAESKSSVMGPPKVLVISREFLKPGRGGAAHKKAEAAFVQAMSSQKSSTHYLGVSSLSGRPRALFFTRYDSFAAWEEDAKATEKNTVLSNALDRAAMADGDLLSDADGGVFLLREDYSLNPDVDIAHMRYFEIGHFHV